MLKECNFCRVYHTLEPIYDKNSKVLILGSMPSVKSREVGFYYGHPRNRFWSTLEIVYGEKIGESIVDKKEFLFKHHIALFDVIKSCDIVGSSDSSIRNVEVNDLNVIIQNSSIKTVFTTGNIAYQLYQKYCYPETKIDAILLPSSSAANQKKGIINELIVNYSKIRDYTG